jgi:uncharacterized membrane protein YqiK
MVRIHLPPPANLARTLRQGWYGDDKPNLQQPLGAISSAFPEIAQMRDRADRNRPLCDLRPQGIAEQRATKLAIEASQAAALAAAQAAEAAAREVALKAVFYAALAKPALVKAPVA